LQLGIFGGYFTINFTTAAG